MSKRVRFFAGHLLLSVCVIGAILAFVLMVWYSAPLARAVGVTQIMLILASIDVIIGPVLGFLVYKEHKKSLKFDLAVIILVQICALGFGVYSVAQGRPVWIVHDVDRFQVVRNNELILGDLTKIRPEFQQVSWGSPQYAAAVFSTDREQRQEDMFTEVAGGISIAQRPERYVPLVEVTPKIQERAKPLAELDNHNDGQNVKKILAKYPNATAFLPLKASSIDMTVLVDKDGNVVKIVDLRPW